MRTAPIRKAKRTLYYSYAIGDLPKGCRLCVKGLKEVVFVTGLCGENCYFCPISDLKKGMDVVYANERKIKKLSEIIEEAAMCGSAGAGITGGNPLIKIDRAVKIIKLLKRRFGRNFHVHLYCPLTNLTETAIKRLERAGLDEIRFHPNLDDDRLWGKIKLRTRMKRGIEIPVIPKKKRQIINLIEFAKEHIAFLNLNELEGADAKACRLAELGFIGKDGLSYGIRGSEGLAFEILDYCARNTRLNVHYCTVKTKDSVQLRNRIKRRARNAKRAYDRLTSNYTFVRGAVYCENANIGKLNSLKYRLIELMRIKPQMIGVDKQKLRLLTTERTARKNAGRLKRMGLRVEIVEEMPTFDEFEIESEQL